MSLTALVICALAAWRVANVLVNERGPFAIGEIVRVLAGVQQTERSHTVGSGPHMQTYATTECRGNNEIARMLCCIYCCSFWTSGIALTLWIFGAGVNLPSAEAIVDWFAIATLCIVVEKVNRYV